MSIDEKIYLIISTTNVYVSQMQNVLDQQGWSRRPVENFGPEPHRFLQFEEEVPSEAVVREVMGNAGLAQHITLEFISLRERFALQEALFLAGDRQRRREFPDLSELEIPDFLR